MVRQRHVPRYRRVAATDEPRIRDGVVGRAKRGGRDQRRAVADEAGDAVDARGLDRIRQGQGRENGGMMDGFLEV